jgi:hypothetical protein
MTQLNKLLKADTAEACKTDTKDKLYPKIFIYSQRGFGGFLNPLPRIFHRAQH